MNYCIRKTAIFSVYNTLVVYVRKFSSQQANPPIRNANSKLNMEIEDEVKQFAARSSRQPTDEEFLELENTVRELRAKYCRDDGGGNGSVASSNSRGKGTTRGSNNSSTRVSENVVQSRDADIDRDEHNKSRHRDSGEGDRGREGGECGSDDKRNADAAGQGS